MEKVAIIGLGIMNNVFQVHSADRAGKAIERRQVKRGRVLAFFSKLEPCKVGIEGALLRARNTDLGHDVKLIPSAYVKPLAKRQRIDTADEEAIAEAMQLPTMRFVPIKAREQQAGMVLDLRHLFVRQQTALINAIRAHLAEFGIVAPQGRDGVQQLVGVVNDAKNDRILDLVPAF